MDIKSTYRTYEQLENISSEQMKRSIEFFKKRIEDLYSSIFSGSEMKFFSLNPDMFCPECLHPVNSVVYQDIWIVKKRKFFRRTLAEQHTQILCMRKNCSFHVTQVYPVYHVHPIEYYFYSNPYQ